MSILGAGLCPIGSTPAGVGRFTEVDSTQKTLFLKADGSRGNTLFVDSQTRDRVMGDRGVPQGADSTAMMVQLAVLTLQNSSAVDGFGLDIVGDGTISASSATQAETKVRAALAHLTSTGRIAILDIRFDRFGPQSALVTIRWVDIATGSVQPTTAQIPTRQVP